jgi:putative ubiquitin-RnfH superfamily antitoxin RatB of RatAB toxin-antitoxin module
MTNKLAMTNEALTKEAVLTQQLTEENLHLKSEVEVYNKKLKELTKENDRVNILLPNLLTLF